MVKVICAGFPKTGTKTLYECLKVLGMKHFEVPDMACYALTEWIQVHFKSCLYKAVILPLVLS